MNRIIALLALPFCVACVYSGNPSLGSCNVPTDCTRPDGGALLGATCNEGRCSYSCKNVCDAAETCDGTNCVLVGPRITSVNAPTTWSLPSQPVTVTAVVDDTPKTGTTSPGIASAALRIAGKPDIAGTTSDTGLTRTYTFTVPGSVQASNSETPVNFTIVAVDANGGATPEGAVGSGQLLIDGVGPKVNGVTVNGGVAVGPAGQQIKWFAQSQSTPIDVQVSIQDAGSGVQQSSLTLMAGGTRFDTGTPTCTTATPPVLTCHFSVVPSTLPTSIVPAAAQRQIQFAIAGTDVAGNVVQTNQAALGIDGKPPTITFTVGASGTTTYPPLNADCNGGQADASLYCGHDGNHFWRSGDSKYTLKFTVNDTYSAPDNLGSGADPASGQCTINGVTTCTVTYDSATGNFTFPADFSGGTFASATDGTGNLNVAVNAKDAVGNAAAQVVTGVAVTRVKWVRQVSLPSVSSTPLLSQSLGLIMVGAGIVTAGSDSIFAIKSVDGTVAWSTGGTRPAGVPAPSISSITGNMALDTTSSTDQSHPTPVLYVNSGTQTFAMHFTATGVDKYCSQAPSTTSVVGSPIIFGGGASAYALAASQDTIVAFQTVLNPNGGGCLRPVFFPPTIPSPSPVFDPPSANGNIIFYGYHTSASDLGLSSVQFGAGSFTAPNSRNIGREPTAGINAAAITPASDLFFGVNNDHTFYRHGTNLAPVTSWSPLPLSSSQNIFSQPTISGNLMFAMSNTLTAIRLDNAAAEWTYSTGLTQVSPPTIATTTYFVSNQQNQEMVAVNASDRASRWAYRGTSSTSPSTRMSSIGTEATLGADGVLYFGDGGGRLYALFVDDTPLATAPGDWPRTGYDNCNSNHSNNPGFVCQ